MTGFIVSHRNDFLEDDRRTAVKKTSALVCFVFLLFGFLHGGDRVAGADGPDRGAGKKVIELVNRVRARGTMCGNRYHRATRPVAWNNTLAQVSLTHSLDMAENGTMGHKGRDGSGPGERIARSGYKWMACGENVCEGQMTPEEAVKAWLNSQGHCENIMNPGFKEAGAAYAKGARRMYWTLVLAAPEFSARISP
jgi:uncharacterized protein YkwD